MSRYELTLPAHLDPNGLSRPCDSTKLGPPFGGKDPGKDPGKELKLSCQPDISTLQRPRHFYFALTHATPRLLTGRDPALLPGCAE